MQQVDLEQVNAGGVIMTLYDLLEICQPGDQVVFYFSGHGDVESKIRNQSGFLLTHETPPDASFFIFF